MRRLLAVTNALMVLWAASACLPMPGELAKDKDKDKADDSTSSEESDADMSSDAPPDAPLLEAASRMGASSAADLEKDPASVFLRIAVDGTATAFDYSEYGTPRGVDLARLTLTADELAGVKGKLVDPPGAGLGFMTINDAALETTYRDVLKKYKAECPACDIVYAGDVATLLFAVAADGILHKAFWRSDMILPENHEIDAKTRLDATRSYVLSLHEDVLTRGKGLVPDAVAAANAEAAKATPGVVYEGRACYFNRSEGEAASDLVVCSVFAEDDVERSSPTHQARVDVTGGKIGAVELLTP